MRNVRLRIGVLTLAAGFMGCGTEEARSEDLVRGDVPEPNAIIAPLIAGKDTVVGEVQVWLDGDSLHVQYVAEDDWQLTQTNLAVSETLDDIPTNHKGCPKMGQFSWSGTLNPAVAEYDVVIALEEVGLDDAEEIVIAAHAEVQSKSDGEEGAWAEGSSFPGCPSVAQYFTVDLDDLREQEVDLAVSYFQAFPSTIHAGDIVGHLTNIANVGAEPFQGPVVVRYWLSQDMAFGGDIEIGSPWVIEFDIAPGSAIGYGYDFAPVIAEEGQYWVFVEVQPQDDLDINPANNVRMDDDPLVITDAPLPISDLTVTGLQAIPPVLGQGEVFTAEWMIANLGPDPFDGAALFRYWLSEDLLLGPEDISLGSLISPLEMAVGQTIFFGPPFVLPPLPPGDYYFIVELSTYLGGMDPNPGNQTTATLIAVTP